MSYLLIGKEWAGFANKRKTLRVTSPEGIQRSSYFISIPLKYGIPLLLSAAVLHWALSQSVFVIRIAAYYWDGTGDMDNSISSVAYSPIATISGKSSSTLLIRATTWLIDNFGFKLV